MADTAVGGDDARAGRRLQPGDRLVAHLARRGDARGVGRRRADEADRHRVEVARRARCRLVDVERFERVVELAREVAGLVGPGVAALAIAHHGGRRIGRAVIHRHRQRLALRRQADDRRGGEGRKQRRHDDVLVGIVGVGRAGRPLPVAGVVATAAVDPAGHRVVEVRLRQRGERIVDVMAGGTVAGDAAVIEVGLAAGLVARVAAGAVVVGISLNREVQAIGERLVVAVAVVALDLGEAGGVGRMAGHTGHLPLGDRPAQLVGAAGADREPGVAIGRDAQRYRRTRRTLTPQGAGKRDGEGDQDREERHESGIAGRNSLRVCAKALHAITVPDSASKQSRRHTLNHFFRRCACWRPRNSQPGLRDPACWPQRRENRTDALRFLSRFAPKKMHRHGIFPD